MSTDDRTTGELRRRVDALESLVVRVWSVVTALLLIGGAVIPYGTGTENGEELTSSVLTSPFYFLRGIGQSDGEELVFAVLAGFGFLGLLIVVLLMLGTLVSINGRSASARTARFVKVLCVLAAIGTGVVLIFMLLYLGADVGEANVGGLVLVLGVIAYGLLLTPQTRMLWEDPDPVSRARGTRPQPTREQP